MRLVRMNIAGFRGFNKEAEFDLDADVIVLSGFNGTGKTSFFDAILWGLTGSIERMGQKASVINKFASVDDARVEIVLRTHDGRELVVVRRLSGIDSPTETLSVTVDGHREIGTSARALLLSELTWGGGDADDSLESLSRWLTKSVYLEQDRVRAFVESSNEQQRFEIVGELVGAASLNRLNRELDSARRAWSAATNRMKDDLSAMRHKHSGLVNRLNDIDSSIDREELLNEAAEWLNTTSRTAQRVKMKKPAKNVGVAVWASTIDRSVGLVAAELRALEELSSDINRMHRKLKHTPTPSADLSKARSTVEDLERMVVQTADDLKDAEEAASATRRKQLTDAEESRSVANLAQLALKHMGDLCPVCNQQHDPKATERRLRELVERVNLQVDTTDELGVAQVADTLAGLESRLAAERQQLFEKESIVRQLDESEARLKSSAESLGFSAIREEADLPNWLDSLKTEVDARSAKLRDAREQGMRVSASLARAFEAGEAEQLRGQIDDLNETITNQTSECALRDEAYEDARVLHEAIRDLEESFVDDELLRIDNLLQDVYAAVDPHPEFRAVRFLTRRQRGRGQLWTTLEAAGDAEPIVVEEPTTVLSSSQLNVLAVATFIAMNLSIKNLPIQVMALDDPLQSLDNVNLLGLTDLLRQLRGQRQLVISTHDDHLVGLLERKLRPISTAERTMTVRLDAWDRSGPVVTTREIDRDNRKLRLAVA